MPPFAIVNRHPLSQPAAIVRLAAHGELPAVTDLLLRANGEYRTVLSPHIFDAYMDDLAKLTASWADKELLIVESDGRLVGAVAFYRDASHQGSSLPQEWAGLRALAVDPAARGRGIGRQLTEACVLRAWRIGRRVLLLHNPAFQATARALYLRMGFERCPRYDFNAGDLPSLDLGGERFAIDAFCLDLKR